MTIDEKKKTVTIVLPLANLEESKSGKTLRVASTEGNIQPGATYDGKPVTVGVNAYIKK
jgi:hypothetical protein